MLDPKFEAPRKNDSPKENTNTQLNKSGNRALVKGPKPLQRLKFYLDVKNHAVTSKLEEKIKKLGGAVEFFLDRDCTHVCSDRQVYLDNQTSASSPCTPRPQSVESYYSNESPVACDTPVSGRLRQKTRADAMLEKVRSQSTNKVSDPLKNAKLWNIPIWTVNKLLSFLDKVDTVTTASQKKKSVKVINIKQPFIKFEPIKRNARPVYKSLKSWPVIDLESHSGKPAFAVASHDVQPRLNKNSEDKLEQKVDSQGTNDSRMTRKQRTRLSVRGAGKDQEVDRLVGGFCEICHCEYREISEHVRSEQHLNFIKNDANFLELDTLISAGANVEAFLRLNGANSYPLFCRRSLRRLNGKTEKCNSGSGNSADDYSPPVTRNKMPRTRSSNNHSSMSPEAETGGHRLRSRGQSWNAPNYQDEDSMGPRSVKEREKSATRFTHNEDEQEPPPKPNPVGRPRKTCPKTKRISADERLVADNKTYYKVEVMTTKLRSSGLGTRESEMVRRSQTPIPEEPEEDDEEQGLVVKFKKVRRSELSVLNDEAENFMFPRKEDPSCSDCDTDEGPNTTKSPLKGVLSSELLSSDRECSKRSIKNEVDEGDDSSVTSYEAEILPTRRKRKRTDTLKSKNCTDDERENSNNSIDNFVSEIGLRRKRRRIYTEVDEHVDESSKDGSTVCESEVAGRRRRRRRTHADIFISDNQRYYKFETPGSRLRIKIKSRYQGMFFPNLLPKQEPPTKNNGECSEVVEPVEEKPPQLPKDDLKYSFEILPTSEPWYQTFTRHDTGNVFYTSTSDPGLCTNFIMPYQLPFIIPMNPKHCVEEYHNKKRSYLKSEAKDSTSAQTQDLVNDNSAEDKKDDDSTSQTASETGNKVEVDRRLIKRKKYKSRFMKLSGHPRKSPRQHASTRAILSSLIHQRKKRERKSHGESDTSRASLASIPEETSVNETILSEEEKQKKVEEEDRITKAIDDILNAPFDDLAEFSMDDQPEELKVGECIDFKHNQDFIDLIQNAENCPNNLRPFRRGRGRYIRKLRILPMTPMSIDCTRNVRRKRKKNRTGWPKKKRLMVVKKTDQKDGEEELNDRENDSTVVELDDSRLTEISMEDENGELEMCDEGEEDVSVCERTTQHDEDHDVGGTDGSGNGSDVSDETDDQNIQGEKCTSNLVDVKSELQNNECSSDLVDSTTNNNSENSDLNSVNNSGNSKTEYAETERTNGAIVKDSLVDVTAVPEPSTVLHEPNNKIAKVTSTPVKNNLNNAKVTPLAVDVSTEVTARALHHPELSSPTNNSMIKMSVSTEFSSNKVATPPKKADTVYSVTILDCKKSVVDAKRVESAEISVKSKWEAAEKVLHFQPFVRMQKIDNSLQSANRRLRSSSSPSPERKAKVKRAKISPTSPRSPRKLRAPRGKWYRER